MTLCALAELRRWRVRHVLNAGFRIRERGHCDAIMRWEAAQSSDPLDGLRATPLPDVEAYRRAGLL